MNSDLFSRTDSNNDYYNQSFKIQAGKAEYVRLIGNALQNNTWQAFTDGAYDRLQHLSVRKTDEQAVSPLEYFGFRVKLPQNYYEQLNIIYKEINKNYTDALAAYTSYKTKWTAANATATKTDDKNLVMANYTNYNEELYQKLKKIDKDGHLAYDSYTEVQYRYASNAKKYFEALTTMEVTVEISDTVDKVQNDGRRSTRPQYHITSTKKSRQFQYSYSVNKPVYQIKNAYSKVFVFNQTLSFDDNKEKYGRRYNYEQMK